VVPCIMLLVEPPTVRTFQIEEAAQSFIQRTLKAGRRGTQLGGGLDP
jgi:hypothetical protein